MSTPAHRAEVIAKAEEIKGSRLPAKMRAALIEDGCFMRQLPEGGPEGVYLSDTPQGALIFEDDAGYPYKDQGDWSCWEANTHLAEGAFLLAENAFGDSYLLSPDAEGVARQLVFADHEIGVLSVLYADIDDPDGKRLEMPAWEPEEEDYAYVSDDEAPKPLMQHRPPPPIPAAPAPSAYPALVFALCAAGTVTVVSMFIGVFMAYRLRQAEPESRAHYTRQIAFFWRALLGWAVAFGLLVISVVLAKMGSGAEGIVLFKAAVLLAFFTQLAFTIGCLFQSFRLSWGYVAGRPVF